MGRRFPREDPMYLGSRIRAKLHTLWLCATYPFAKAGDQLSIHYTADIRRCMAHYIRLGNRVSVMQDAWLNVSREDDDASPAIVIEDGCKIARRTMISAKNLVHLEAEVILSPSVLIMDHSHSFDDILRPIEEQGVTTGGRVRIGQGCWIGHGAAIVCTSGELVIGRNSVIAANALVTHSVPPGSVVSGNPARIVKHFDFMTHTWVLGAGPAPDLRTIEKEFSPAGR